MESYPTILDLDKYRKGIYPVGLEDAVSILVLQKENVVNYGLINRVIEAERAIQTMKANGEGYIACTLGTNIITEINSHITNVSKNIRGLFEIGYINNYVSAYMHAKELREKQICIKKPNEESFRFEINPHMFNLGYTGRLLTNGDEVFNEELFVKCSIYDAFDIAKIFDSKTIFARMKDGTLRLLKQGETLIGEYEKVRNIEKKATLAFSDKVRLNFEPEILKNQDELTPIVSDEFNEVAKNYGYNPVMIFGSTLDHYEIINKGIDKGYLFWKVASNCRRDPCLESCERFGKTFPERIDRYHIMPNRARIDFGNVELLFDSASAYNSLFAINDSITDIWVHVYLSAFEEMHEAANNYLRKDGIEITGDMGEDIQRFYELTRDLTLLHEKIPKFDIIYDKREGITPKNPVKVRSDETVLKYAVRQQTHGECK